MVSAECEGVGKHSQSFTKISRKSHVEIKQVIKIHLINRVEQRTAAGMLTGFYGLQVFQ
jgi:hypothetical protein